jgi:hypothetical protein
LGGSGTLGVGVGFGVGFTVGFGVGFGVGVFLGVLLALLPADVLGACGDELEGPLLLPGTLGATDGAAGDVTELEPAGLVSGEFDAELLAGAAIVVGTLIVLSEAPITHPTASPTTARLPTIVRTPRLRRARRASITAP